MTGLAAGAARRPADMGAAMRSTEQALLAQAQQQARHLGVALPASLGAACRGGHLAGCRAGPAAPARRARAVLSGAAGWRAAYPGQRRPRWRNSTTAGVGRHGAGAGRGRRFPWRGDARAGPGERRLRPLRCLPGARACRAGAGDSGRHRASRSPSSCSAWR
ncbi:MAG: hypothetical protein MZW92_11695 [Comamonadaceae bacterium]|nr:hypothetical protein [Comamonadaceae bacterium]